MQFFVLDIFECKSSIISHFMFTFCINLLSLSRSEHPTGRCAVLITGQDRSLVTKLDAANHFTR